MSGSKVLHYQTTTSSTDAAITPRAQRLKESFAQIEKQSHIAALMFYRHLFTRAPQFRAMFHGDIEVQGRKLMEALRFTVDNFERAEQLTPALEAMGRRHLSYGVKDEHYEVVGAALLQTLKDALGPAFTPDVADDWSYAFALVAAVMKRGAAQALPPK